jgi:hypothetical protein
MDGLTTHCRMRMRQRGISANTLELLLRHGQERAAPGGASMILADRQSIAARIQFLKSEMRQLESLRDVALIVAEDGSAITVEHRNRRIWRT